MGGFGLRLLFYGSMVFLLAALYLQMGFIDLLVGIGTALLIASFVEILASGKLDASDDKKPKTQRPEIDRKI